MTPPSFPKIPKDAPPEIKDEARRCGQLYSNYVDAYAAYVDCVEALQKRLDALNRGGQRPPAGPGSGGTPFGRFAPRLPQVPITPGRAPFSFSWNMLT